MDVDNSFGDRTRLHCASYLWDWKFRAQNLAVTPREFHYGKFYGSLLCAWAILAVI
jgi:hypothetical protein